MVKVNKLETSNKHNLKLTECGTAHKPFPIQPATF